VAPVAPVPPLAGAEPATPGVFTRPPAPPADRQDFLKGVLVGAGLVLAGVVAGAVVTRRR
jgi:uncharacterized protein